MAKQTLYMCDLCLTDKLSKDDVVKMKLPRLTLGLTEYTKPEGEICLDCCTELGKLLDKIAVLDLPIEDEPHAA